jgi:diguanylate cyclase (GGDEF)-like protein
MLNSTEISSNPLTILVVDDQKSALAVLASQLDAMGHKVLGADNATWALEQFGQHKPDLVLLDVEMPDHDGYWVAKEMRAAEAGRWTPIIFLSARDTDQDLWRGIESGGDDYLVKPVSPVVLTAKLRAMTRLKNMQTQLVALSAELRQTNEQLQHLSEHDTLTGLFNRRGFNRLFNTEIASARRDNQPLTLVLCDLDFFKRYNDSLGHLAGDECLRILGTVLKKACRRPRDTAARYGGEEFALVLPNTPKSGAMTFARALSRMLSSLALPHPASPDTGLVTISGGITTCIPDEDTTVESMVLRADQALYAAKAKGRNQFFSFEMQLSSLDC